MISKATISFIQSLKQKKYRQKYDKFLLEGEKIILEGLQQGNISFDTIYCLEEKAPLLGHINIKYNIIDSKTLGKISNLKTPPGILAIANVPKQSKLNELNLSGITLFLDGIQDPGNMGTIIRTAEWFGVKTIVATPESVEFYNPKVIQASMGSFARVSLINANLEDLPVELPIYTTVLDGISVYDFEPPKDFILVIGSESHGASAKVIQASKEKLTIPSSPGSKAESLNAGIATAVMLGVLSKLVLEN